MSVSTPILTTSSEICAFAAPPDAAKTRMAATAAATDFMVSSPCFLWTAWWSGVSSIRLHACPQSRRLRRQNQTDDKKGGQANALRTSKQRECRRIGRRFAQEISMHGCKLISKLSHFNMYKCTDRCTTRHFLSI